MFKSLKPLVLAALLCAAAGSQAAITVYTNQADFLAAVSAPGYDNYDDLVVDLYDSPLARTAGVYGYEAASPSGLYGAGTGTDHWLSTNAPLDPIVFQNFTGGVSAFGGYFFASDIAGGYVPSGNLVLTADDGSTLTYTLTGATQNSFLGFVSDATLDTVTLATDGGAYWPTANDVVLAVPEPATYGMLLAGLGFVGAVTRRRHS